MGESTTVMSPMGCNKTKCHLAVLLLLITIILCEARRKTKKETPTPPPPTPPTPDGPKTHHIQGPALSAEEKGSTRIPASMQCDACRGVMHLFRDAFERLKAQGKTYT